MQVVTVAVCMQVVNVAICMQVLNVVICMRVVTVVVCMQVEAVVSCMQVVNVVICMQVVSVVMWGRVRNGLGSCSVGQLARYADMHIRGDCWYVSGTVVWEVSWSVAVGPLARA